MHEDEKFYKGKHWKSLRESILKRDGYMCQYCKRFGKRVQADHVHHVLPREFYPEYTYSPWNLISLCKVCHNTMHYRTDKSLTDTGMELVKIVARKNFLDLDKILKSEKEQQSTKNH